MLPLNSNQLIEINDSIPFDSTASGFLAMITLTLPSLIRTWFTESSERYPNVTPAIPTWTPVRDTAFLDLIEASESLVVLNPWCQCGQPEFLSTFIIMPSQRLLFGQKELA